MICEEFAHMDNKVFNVVVVPTLVTEASFIGITTLGEDSNFVNELVEIKDETGKGLFNYVKIDLVCDRCKKLGKESSCTHLMGEIPYWQDAKRHKEIQLMMQHDHDTYMREARYVKTGSYFIILNHREKKSTTVVFNQIHL